MWDQDWALLGIAPTTELGAIKKAYALKLKVTRPDDDAEAYQALRTAYERAQQWVRWQERQEAQAAEEDADDNEAQSAVPVVVEQAAEVAPAHPAKPEEPAVYAEDLVQQLDVLWRRVSQEALLRGWADVRLTLDQQPLRRQAEFSDEFAQWVLRNPALPDELLHALNDHFGWLDDFRTERLLGLPLTHALHEAIGPRLRPAAPPEAVQELAGPLHTLAALREVPGAWWRLHWLFLLLQPLLTRNLDQLGADWLTRLDLPNEWLRRHAQQAFWLRVGLATLLCWGVGFVALRDGVAAAGHTAIWLVATMVYLFVALMAGALIGVGPHWKTGGGRIGGLLERWRRHPAQPWLGLAWLLFAALLVWLHGSPQALGGGSVLALLPPGGYVFFAWCFGLAGLLVAWPLDMLRGCVTLALMPLVGYFMSAAFGAWLPTASCLLIGAAWLLASAAVHEERTGLPESSPARWLLRPALNSLLLMDRWTYPLALAPLAAAGAWFELGKDQVRPTDIFLIWVLVILAVGWLQNKADALGLRLLRTWRPTHGD